MISVALKDYKLALDLRDAIVKICEQTVTRMRPDVRNVQVTAINRFTLKALVLLSGETTPIQVGFSRALQPGAVGDVVQISGKPGNYYISRVFGQVFNNGGMSYNPVLMGGTFFNEEHEHFWGGTVSLPTVGNSMYMGKWSNSGSFLGIDQGAAVVRLRVSHTFFTSENKWYTFVIQNYTSTGWTNLMPDKESGSYGGNDFAVECKIIGADMEFRIRRLNDGGGTPPGGFRYSIWITGESWRQTVLASTVLDTDPRPSVSFGTVRQGRNDDANAHDAGPWFDSLRNIVQARMPVMLSGGYPIVLGAVLKWTPTMYAIVGGNQLAASGVLQIAMPATSTSYAIYGSSTGTSATTTADGFNMAYGGATESALYYEPPLDGSTASLSTNFRLVTQDYKYAVPSHWIRIAVYDSRSGVSMPNGSAMDSGWITANVTSNAGWDLTGTKYRISGNVYEVKVAFTRTGSALVFTETDGDFADQTIGGIPSGFAPTTLSINLGKWGGRMIGGRLQANGNIIIDNWGASGASVTFGTSTTGSMNFSGFLN